MATFKPAVKPPLKAILSISTGHLCKATRDWLDGLDWDHEGPSGGKSAYGWFMYAHDDNECHPSAPHAPDGEFPADLWACFEKAREMGADYVMFDCDDEPDPELLPVYDDEEAEADA